ncbi:glycosyltransferase family 2 protein [Vibrio parahaemolyticus]|uniref:glycosyltransferase family 2 protein n=1 Tax=Vibrio parahaemolyticus TaxID=670 RepID=UPI0003F8BE9E|nr:glycosyltransferase [Vibrio parahaemolyticus]EKI0736902.1 glycosyltransferase [Vibrio parahaemolyticus]MBE4262396.1 glycosyltransferase [Vibrio parahaemolyticus]HAS6638724.1 glycosyltransferase [Vibrio parahaemolyticus]
MGVSLKPDLVSIIMPSFNAEGTIREAILSVLNQSYSDFELIICDDCSTDTTVKVINEFNDHRVKVLLNDKNNGAAFSRNRALSVAKGQYLAFLDSDDTWSKNKLKVQVNHMRSTGCLLTYGAYNVIDQNGTVVGGFTPREKLNFKQLCRTCEIGCLTVMINRAVLNGNSFRFPSSPKEDYAAWVSLIKNSNLEFLKYPGVLCNYRIGSQSLSSNKFSEIEKQYFVLRNYAGLSIPHALMCLMFYINFGIKKHLLSYRSKSCS